MRARCYVKEIQQLHKEADECFRKISLIGETQTKLSAKNIIDTLEDTVDELYEDYSSLIAQANHMVSNLTQLDELLKLLFLSTATTVVTLGRTLQTSSALTLDRLRNFTATHSVHYRGNPALMWDETNYQALCKPCHDKKTLTEDKNPVYSY